MIVLVGNTGSGITLLDDAHDVADTDMVTVTHRFEGDLFARACSVESVIVTDAFEYRTIFVPRYGVDSSELTWR